LISRADNILFRESYDPDPFAIAKSTFMISHETSSEYHLGFVVEGAVPSEVPVTVAYQHIPDRFPDIPFLVWQT